jgi:hypothetical protein
MALRGNCATCGEFGAVFPKGSNQTKFLFCSKCFPKADVRVTSSGGVSLFHKDGITVVEPKGK